MVLSGRVVTWVVLVALVALPSAAAETAQFEFEGTLPLEATGTARLGAEAPVVLFQSLGGDATWSMRADDVRVVHVEYWQEEPGQLVTRTSAQSGVRTTEHHLHAADLQVRERLPGFTSLLWGDADAATHVDGPAEATDVEPAALDGPVDLRMFRLGAPLTVTAPTLDDALVAGTVLGRPVPFRYEVPAGDLHLQAPDADHTLAGAMEGYLTGAVLEARHAQGLLRLSLVETVESRPGSVYVPDEGWTGPGSHTERINHYVQFVTADGRFALTTEDAPAAVFAPTVDLDLTGRLSLARATGAVAFDGGVTRELEGDGVVLAGNMAASMTGAEEAHRARVTGSGDVAYLRAAGVAEVFAYGHMAATAVGVAALVGAALVVWKLGGGAGITLFSRVAKAGVLDHDTRAELYTLVKAQPGCTPNDLVESTGIGWSTVMYHLNVLERNDLVAAMKDGRYRRYFDRQSGRFANGRKNVVAALKNETTAAIAQVIRDEPGQVQRRLAERFGLAASSVHWHVARLDAAGLVEKRRVGQRVELFPGPAWDVIDEERAIVEAGSDAEAPVPARGDARSASGADATAA